MIIKVRFAAWFWNEDDVRSENEVERKYGLDLTRPGFYAQRQRDDAEGWCKARRFSTAEARDKWINDEGARVRSRMRAQCAILVIEEH